MAIEAKLGKGPISSENIPLGPGNGALRPWCWLWLQFQEKETEPRKGTTPLKALRGLYVCNPASSKGQVSRL